MTGLLVPAEENDKGIKTESTDVDVDGLCCPLVLLLLLLPNALIPLDDICSSWVSSVFALSCALIMAGTEVKADEIESEVDIS